LTYFECTIKYMAPGSFGKFSEYTGQYNVIMELD
jgi:hypothetical protein